MPCDEMSAYWAAQRIKGLSLGAAVLVGRKRSLGLNRAPNDGMATKTLRETFRYPRLGPGMMWEAAAGKVRAGGNHVLMGHSFKQLTQDQKTGRWRLTETGPDGDIVIDAEHVVSSAPMRELAARIHPLPASASTAERRVGKEWVRTCSTRWSPYT